MTATAQLSLPEALTAFEKSHAAHFSGKNLSAPTRDWYEAIEDLCEAFAVTPPSMRFFRAAGELMTAYIDLMEKVTRGEIALHPTDKAELENLEAALAPLGRAISLVRQANNAAEPHPPILETIPQLLACRGDSDTEIGLEQMSLMYGLPQHEMQKLVEKAKNKEPYSLPAGHQSPDQKRWHEERRRERSAYAAAAFRWQANKPGFGEEPAVVDTWSPPPESVRELLDQGVSVEQIALMHRITQAEVQQVASGGVVQKAAEPAKVEQPKHQQHGNHGKR